MPLQRPPQLAWPYLNPNSPLYQGLVFAGLGPHPGGYDYHDCSPYRNNGLLTNMDPATDWVWSPELGRWALDFDGTNDVVEIPNTSLPSDFTLAGWGYITGENEAPTTFEFAVSSGSFTRLIALRVISSSQCHAYIRVGGTNYDEYVVSSNLFNVWRHFTLRRKGDLARTFLDGITMGSGGAVSGNTPPESVGRLFKTWDNTPRFTTGKSVDPLIYNRALSLSEIAALADPSNAMLAIGNTPLILTRRRLFPVAAVGGGVSPTGTIFGSLIGPMGGVT